jgi:hypothetical protein
LGVLDVGSNSVKLQVIDGRAGAPPLPTSAFKDGVKLAQRTDGNGAITHDGTRRLVEAIHRATAVAESQGVSELTAFAVVRREVRHGIAEVAERLRWEGVPSSAVATSKTFKQLARLAGAPPERKGPVTRRVLDRSALERWTERMTDMTAKERGALRGASRGRSEQILAGAIVASEVMHALDIASLEICPWALREGVLLRRLDHLHHPAERHDAAIISTATLVPEQDRREPRCCHHLPGRFWLTNPALLLGAEFDTELERRREVESGNRAARNRSSCRSVGGRSVDAARTSERVTSVGPPELPLAGADRAREPRAACGPFATSGRISRSRSSSPSTTKDTGSTSTRASCWTTRRACRGAAGSCSSTTGVPTTRPNVSTS